MSWVTASAVRALSLADSVVDWAVRIGTGGGGTIYVELDKPAYYAGQMIAGTVVASIRSPGGCLFRQARVTRCLCLTTHPHATQWTATRWRSACR